MAKRGAARVSCVMKMKADAVLAASIFHFGQFSIQEAKTYLAKRGLVIRN